MRCAACDKIMTEFEMALRAPESRQFADLCGICYNISYDLDDKDEDIVGIIQGDITHEQDW